MEAVLRIDRGDADFIEALLAVPELQPERFDAVGIDGGGDVATIIVSLSGATLTALVTTLRAWWGRARYVKIEVDGVKIEGVSPSQVEALLTRMIADRGDGEARTDVPEA